MSADDDFGGGGEQRATAADDSEEDRRGGIGLTRRQLLAAGGLGGGGLLALALLSQGGSSGGGSSTPTPTQSPAGPTETSTPAGPTEQVPYAVWDEVRAALRTSPDHLPARADALMADGDLEAIFEFVRDEIVTLPAGREGVGRFSINEAVRWGARGTLRGGAGTPREKAELLADLLEEAGAETELVEGRTPLSGEEIRDLYLRPVGQEFDPDFDDGQMQNWTERLGVADADVAEIERLDADGQASTALGTDLFAAVAEDWWWQYDFSWNLDTDLPVVRFRTADDDEDRYANLFADAPFGESGTTRIDEIADASLPDVTVTLSAARASDPERTIDLASGTWTASDVVGRQVVVSTLPGIDPFQQPGVRFSDIDTFVPSLAVQGGDVDQATAAELSVLGDPVTRGGDRFSVSEDGTVSRNGQPLAATGDATAASRVESVSVISDVSRYPEIRLTVDARDAAGDRVEGLPANAVGLREEGEGAGVTLQSNAATPRVAVLYDTSGSMPQEYSGEAMQAFVSELTAEIEAVDPDARIELVATDSNIWTAAAEAAATDANVVVYATDGDVADERTPEIEGVLRAGPPVVMLSTNDGTTVEDDSALAIADLSGGEAVAARDRDAAREAVRTFVADIAAELRPYQLTYRSPVESEAGTEHTVSVTIGEATGETTYTVPETALPPPRLSSLWLTVSVGGRSVTRLLAGYEPDVDENVTEEMISAVEGALFGATTLTFEAGSPSLSVWLDDFLAAKGSTREMDAAIVAEDQEAIEAASAAGLWSVDPEAFLLTPPLPNAASETSLTFPDAIRVAAYTHHPVFGSDESRISGDILPLTRYATAMAGQSEESTEPHRLTLERTARLAVAETAGFETSTQSLLADTPVVPFGAADEEAWGQDRHDRFDAFVDRTGHRGAEGMGHRIAALVPEDGSVFAYWNVDLETGGVLGVLPDGTNGGSTRRRHERILNELSRVVSAINLLAMATGAGGLALGVVAQYGQVLARLYAAVAMAIEMMDASALPDAIAAAKAELICRIARRAFLEVVPLGKAFRSISNLMNVVTGTTPASC